MRGIISRPSLGPQNSSLRCLTSPGTGTLGTAVSSLLRPRPPHFPGRYICSPWAWCSEQNKVLALRKLMFLLTRQTRHKPPVGMSHMSSSLTVSILGLNPQPPGKDLKQRKYSEPMVPESNSSSLPLLDGPRPSTSTPGTHPLPFRCPAGPWEVTSPSLARFQCSHCTLALSPGSSLSLPTLQTQAEPQAAHPDQNPSHGASETTRDRREQPGKTTPMSRRPQRVLLNLVFASLRSSPPPRMWFPRLVLQAEDRPCRKESRPFSEGKI